MIGFNKKVVSNVKGRFMQKIAATVLLIILSTVVMTGCAEKAPEPPPPAPEEPPPPSPDQIFGELKAAIQVLWGPLTQQTHVSKEDREQAVNNLRPIKAKYAGIDNGKIALSRLEREVEDLIRTARDREMWGVVKGGISVYSELKPGNDRYVTLNQRADLMLARPKVTVNGFFNVEGDIYAFLEVNDPAADPPIQSYRIREGEEFHGNLRLIRIIGAQKAVELLYIPANSTWEVSGPRN
jgi:hypothetical protein